MKEARRILVVEDDPRDREFILLALKEKNVVNRVDIARDGEEALDYLHRRGKYQGRAGGNPAVVLLDLKLPKLSGHQVLREIRAVEKLRLVPVVVLTSSREDDDLARSYQEGVNAYVVKPVDFEGFSEAVKTLGLFWSVVNEPPLEAEQ